MRSCLSTLDQLLHQPHVVVSSYVLDESAGAKRYDGSWSTAPLRDAVAHILGVKDASTVNANRSLGDFGVDSLMVVEIQQTLQRQCEISLSSSEIRALTFANLDQLSTSTRQSASATATSSASLHHSRTTSMQYEIRHFHLTEAVVQLNDVETDAVPLFVVPPINGSVYVLSSLMSKIQTTKVYGLQCTDDAPLTSIPDLASHCIKMMKTVCQNGPVRLAGYSFGACVAIEMALQLQQQYGVQSLVLIDGSQSYSATANRLRTQSLGILLGDVAGTESAIICRFVSLFVFRLAHSQEAAAKIDMLKLGAELQSQTDWDARVSRMTTALVSAGVTTAELSSNLRQAVTSYYRKLLIAENYQPTSVLSESTRVTLLRAADDNIKEVEYLGEDYGLSSVCAGSVDVHVLPGTHESFVMDADTSTRMARLIDKLLPGY